MSKLDTNSASAPQRATAKIFMNGRSQAVRLPAFCRFEGQQVNIERVGDRVILSPHRPSWSDYFAEIDRPSDDFMSERDMQFTPREELL